VQFTYERLAFNLKEHFLILFLVITTSITIFIFTLTNSHVPIPVFNANDILFEHHTIHGNIIVSTNPYDELILAFAGHNIGSMEYLGSVATVIDSDMIHLVLPATDTIPFTTHTIVSTNPDLHEIIVMRTNTSIAHQAHAKKTACDETAVFMVSSTDLTDGGVLIIGLAANNEIILEIEIP